MKIRQAELKDAVALSHLLAQVWRVAYKGIFPQSFLDNIQDNGWVEGFQKSLADPQSQIFVAEIEQNIIGMIAFGKGRDEQLNIAHEIYALNVLPDFQRQQVGSTLMNFALNEKGLGKRGGYLKVAQQNTQAQHFYQKLGFYNTEMEQERQIADFCFKEWIYRL